MGFSSTWRIIGGKGKNELVGYGGRSSRPFVPPGKRSGLSRRPQCCSMEAPPGRRVGVVRTRHRLDCRRQRLSPSQGLSQTRGRPRFGVSLGLFVDCLNAFSVPGQSSVIQIQYPGPDMQVLLKSVDSLDASICAEIRTRIPNTIFWDYNFEPAGTNPLTFTVKSAALKEAIEDLEWPGSSIQIILEPDPPSVTLRAEGHGDLQIDFMYYVNSDLLVAFQCDHRASFKYKYKFLRATTSNMPSSVIKENRGSKLSIGRGGMLKVQHLVSIAKPSVSNVDSICYQQPGRIAHIEFFVKPEDDSMNDY